MRIRAHLLLLGALVLVPSGLAAWFAVGSLESAAREASVRGLLEAVRSSALLVDGEVKGSLGGLRALAASRSLATGDLRALYEEASALDQPGEVWTVVLDDQGRQVVNTGKPFETPLAAPPVKPTVDALWATGRPIVTDLFVGAVSHKLHTMFYLPARGPGGARWAVGQAYSAERWNRAALRPSGRPDWVVAVVDRQGLIMARTARGEELLGKPARPQLVAAAKTEASGVLRHRTLDEVEAYVAFDHSELTGWTIAIGAPAAPIDNLARRSAAVLAAGLFAALLVGALGALAIGRRIARGLSRAAEYAAAIDSGAPIREPEATGVDEADSLNRALTARSRELGAERAAREGLETQREALLAEQTRARERAERENEAKDRFVAQLGHEIRNPMAAIGGAAEVLSILPSPGADYDKWVGVVRRQNGRLRRIVDDLLDVSRMLAGKTWIEPTATDLRPAVAQCLADLRASEHGRGREITESLDNVRALADAARLEQALANLVGNALRYAPEGTAVQVALRLVEGGAEIRVADRGPGIDPAALPNLFQPFAQGAPAPGAVATGLGIGLALARQVAELHGGDLSAEETPGGGATFVMWIPALNSSGSSPR